MYYSIVPYYKNHLIFLLQKNVKHRKWGIEYLQQLLRWYCARDFDESQIPVTG